jgi:DNA-binding response OmpR family regulator
MSNEKDTTTQTKATALPLLIIEDEEPIQAFLRTALERNGYTVVIVSSGTEGLRILKEQEFAAVISDMRTPGGVNGADVHEWLTNNRPTLAQHMLFVTGDIVNEETVEILNKTGVPYIEKPFRVRELIETVQKVMQK